MAIQNGNRCRLLAQVGPRHASLDVARVPWFDAKNRRQNAEEFSPQEAQKTQKEERKGRNESRNSDLFLFVTFVLLVAKMPFLFPFLRHRVPFRGQSVFHQPACQTRNPGDALAASVENA